MSLIEKSTPRFVRCKDNMLHQERLTVGEVYEVNGEQHGNYLVRGLWLTKRRFAAVDDGEAKC
ncbi:hypothetical protein IVA94_14760 [Bradyrhizobium sp. 156]|uniref:hypothetical protein n=1 Tax=Bradyrhizobium sp. 156 TaxID=2782630 RepID=UPI001FF72D56|nr:hypothetical protein [Bradyrhizobium sp. 156]MCK1322130.1 hypothetical protein [Bradyrhizobium sp. 156]